MLAAVLCIYNCWLLVNNHGTNLQVTSLSTCCHTILGSTLFILYLQHNKIIQLLATLDDFYLILIHLDIMVGEIDLRVNLFQTIVDVQSPKLHQAEHLIMDFI